jgi:hypothetical protein
MLQVRIHSAIFLTTCLGISVRNKLHGVLHRVDYRAIGKIVARQANSNSLPLWAMFAEPCIGVSRV